MFPPHGNFLQFCMSNTYLSALSLLVQMDLSILFKSPLLIFFQQVFVLKSGEFAKLRLGPSTFFFSLKLKLGIGFSFFFMCKSLIAVNGIKFFLPIIFRLVLMIHLVPVDTWNHKKFLLRLLASGGMLEIFKS